MTSQTPLATTVRLYDRTVGSLPWRELAARLIGLMVQPRAEWARIADGSGQVRDTLVPYAIALALFAPLMQSVSQLAMVVVGAASPSPLGLMQGLLTFGLRAVLNFLVVYGLVQIVHGVALQHGKKVENLAAFKLVVYGLTAFFISQGLGHLPVIGGVAVFLGLYSLYQLYLGTALLIEADPADQPRVNLMVPGLALAFYAAVLGIAGLIVWLAR